MASNLGNLSSKRVRDDSDDLRFVKRLREDLLDDSYPESANQDLDSVIRSLEEEISNSPAPESGESRPEIGYLLEASDDELGLPPASSEEVPAEEAEFVPVESGIGEFCWFDDEFPSYDSFGFGFGFGGGCDGSDDYVAVDGLFEYSDDVVFDSADFPWRSESLPA